MFTIREIINAVFRYFPHEPGPHPAIFIYEHNYGYLYTQKSRRDDFIFLDYYIYFSQKEKKIVTTRAISIPFGKTNALKNIFTQ